MNNAKHTKAELEQAYKAILSTLHKCEKAFEKLEVGTSQYTLMERRIAAFQVALELIGEKLNP
ncbi:MAG: hypothetical protein FWB93_06545 [Oscillospiraceae bacterium]|nr:hypothetical protein [Oscillospiraceae bacterium]